MLAYKMAFGHSLTNKPQDLGMQVSCALKDNGRILILFYEELNLNFEKTGASKGGTDATWHSSSFSEA